MAQMDGTKFLELNQSVRILQKDSDQGEWSVSTIQDIDAKAFYIAVPVRRTVPLKLREGDNLNIQIPGQTGIVLFTTKVVGLRRDAIPLIALALPDKVERIERRSFVRLPLLLESSLAEVLEDGKEPVWTRGQMLDISGGGLRIAVRRNLKKGARVMVSFSLPIGSGKEAIIAEGEIMRILEATQSGNTQVGVEFINLPTKHQDCIIRFIFEKLKEAGRMRSEIDK
jgi:c-di-GMP-binding flagellar brake protein YcgR